jgi:hypothetical protein
MTPRTRSTPRTRTSSRIRRTGTGLPRGFDLWRETRLADPGYRFVLPLPSGWAPAGEPGRPPGKPGAAAPLAGFASPREPRTEATVSGWHLKRDVAPARFLEVVIGLCGEEILERNESDDPGGRVLDVLCRKPVEGGSLAIRRKAIKDGHRLLILRTLSREADYPGVAARLSTMLNGFRFLEPSGWHCAETLSTLSRRLPGDFLLFFPRSWRIEGSVVARPQLFSVRFRNDLDSETVGVIDLAVVSRDAEPELERVAEEAHRRLVRGGLRCTTLPLGPIPPFGPFKAAWGASTEATVDDRPMELYQLIGQRPDAWFVFTLQGPTRKTAADVWVVNRRALEIVSGFLATPDHPCERWISRAFETKD